MIKAVQYAILTATSPQGTREKNTLEAEKKLMRRVVCAVLALQKGMAK